MIYIFHIINSFWYGRMTITRKSPIHCIICSLYFHSGEILLLCGKKKVMHQKPTVVYIPVIPAEGNRCIGRRQEDI